MGAKQSKRSVDISGKEAENAGEVAAAGAGGEGRVEQLADADIKPQLNGDAHIQPPLEISDKEKQLDSGTPENEKDATTEKEGKEEQNGEKEPTPVTNGDSEPKEDGESVPTPEDGKKPKKEKVKKKWSLRSISFSRKDKPKQEKKSKEEEPKTNGEPEKVPEEAAEATPESVENKIAEVAPTIAEVKEEKTPSTPVTEPMTNGNSTPSSPAAELAADPPAAPAEPTPAAVETTPEQLPVNGLSLDEPEPGEPAAPVVEETKPEAPAPVPELTPAPEIPVKTEVCAARVPLVEPTPPPLPANPPPSSVASFAATTMAPESVEASLANTARNAISTPPAIPDAAADKVDEPSSETPQIDITNLDVTQISPPLKETAGEIAPAPVTTSEAENGEARSGSEIVDNTPEVVKHEPEVIKTEDTLTSEHDVDESIKTHVETVEICEIPKAEPDLESKIVNPPSVEAAPVPIVNGNGSIDTQSPGAEDANGIDNAAPVDPCSDTDHQHSEAPSDGPDSSEDLPPPPPEEDFSLRSDDIKPAPDADTLPEDTNNHAEANDIADETAQKKLKNKKVDALGNIVDKIECNGNADPEALPAPRAATPPPAEPAAATDQEPVADKIADLIPEIPTIPELKTETESAVAVAD
ncbi:A-kinase anchor protein 200-like [Cydia amplana]|uniref:A-kinase anchor protein 200-like n=1 Tax=Cydia amplana TaxID=1869771 RepID=UPI002FE5AF2E